MKQFQPSDLTNKIVNALSIAAEVLDNTYLSPDAEVTLKDIQDLLRKIKENKLDIRMVSREY